MMGRGRRAGLITIGCALLLAAVAGLPLAAEAGSFTLVPRGHWVYDAIDRLTSTAGDDSSGTEAGEGPPPDNPDEPLTRYELATRVRELEQELQISGKAGSQTLLDRLTAEFAPELERRSGKKRLTIRLDQVLRRARRAINRGDADAPVQQPHIQPHVEGEASLPSLPTPDASHETLRSSLRKLSRLEADFALGSEARLRGEFSIHPDTLDNGSKLRGAGAGASAGVEITLSPTTTLSTAYAIGRDGGVGAEHSARFDLEYQITEETSIRAAYRLINFDEESRSSAAEAEISIRF